MMALSFRNACAAAAAIVLALSTSAWAQSPVLIVLDPSAIDYGPSPHLIAAEAANAGVAKTGLRDQLPYFSARIGDSLTLPSGGNDNDGWFAIRQAPSAWNSSDAEQDGLSNYLLAGPGLGSPDEAGDRASLLHDVADVVPLRADGLALLVGRDVCAIVYSDDVTVIAGATSRANLSGPNLGVVSFRVTAIDSAAASNWPGVTFEILDARRTCTDAVIAMPEAPAHQEP
jgi:hypothetical protein